MLALTSRAAEGSRSNLRMLTRPRLRRLSQQHSRVPKIRTQVLQVQQHQEGFVTPPEDNRGSLLHRFLAFDVDGNGSIDRQELRHLLQSVGSGTASPRLPQKHWLPEEELDRVMQTYDKDGDGVIEFEEFTKIVYDGLLLDGKLSEYEEAFNAVDKSGNGTISAMELAQLLRDLGREVSFDKIFAFMERYDKDESGQIEFSEFLQMFRDQTLGLPDVLGHLANQPASGSHQSHAILEPREGDVSIIFSERELDEVLARRDRLTVVFAALTWCRSCKSMQRPAVKLAQHYKDSFTFITIFGNSNEQTKRLFADKLQVRSTPCFMIYQGDQLLGTYSGSTKEKLEDALRASVPEGRAPADRLFPPSQPSQA